MIHWSSWLLLRMECTDLQGLEKLVLGLITVLGNDRHKDHRGPAQCHVQHMMTATSIPHLSNLKELALTYPQEEMDNPQVL